MDNENENALRRVNHLDKALNILDELSISCEDWCLVASAVLAIHGIRENRDLDICVRNSVYEQLVSLANYKGWVIGRSGTVKVQDIDFVRDEYALQGIDSDQLINNTALHSLVGGIKVARLELEFAKKAWSPRLKDRTDIPQLEEYALSHSGWNWSLVREPIKDPRDSLPLYHRMLRKAYVAAIRARRRLGRIITTASISPTKKPRDGLLLGIILWPPAEHLFDEITEELRRSHRILSCFDVVFTKDAFATMVRRVYAYENIPKWIIERKLYFMSRYRCRIRFLNLLLDNPRWRVNEEGTRFVSGYSQDLKVRYRTKYRVRINNYIHDVVMHTGETDEQCQWLRETVFALGDVLS
jgi:hypothetical protein